MKAENIIGPVEIVEKPERTYLGIKVQTPFPGMFAEATQALRELRKWAKSNSVSEDGPYFIRYYHCDMSEIMEIEVGLFVPNGTSGDERIQPGSMPKGRYATLIYRGNGLRGNQALMKWAVDNGVKFEPIDPNLKEFYVCRYEAYLTDYRVESRKLLWDVELSIKVID
ncbi:MAG TPA: GyrI-like domain-containing protein [Fimbriimonas sp.]|nr:GyrI-like domain-containing protein [Fimbriimonas sp.]